MAPHGGPPLHVHHRQEETIHVLKGRFKIRIGDSIFYLNEGGFAYLPSKVPHAFLNLTDEGGEIILVYTPGGGHKFYEELGPVSRSASPDRQKIAALFEKYGMTLLGAPVDGGLEPAGQNNQACSPKNTIPLEDAAQPALRCTF